MSVSEASALFDVVGEGAPVGLAFVDTDLRYVRINAALATINGRPAEAHIGRRVDEVLPEIADQLVPIYRHVLETGEPITERDIVAALAGAPARHMLASWFPVRVGGDIAGVGVVVVDVTARAVAEERLRTVVHQLPVGVVIADGTGNLVLTNSRLEEMGLHRGAAGAPIADQPAIFWRPNGRPYEPGEWPLTRSLTTGEVVRGEEMEFVRADGNHGVLEANSAPIRDAAGAIVAAVVVIQDITERRSVADRQDLLVRVGEVLDSALGVDDRLNRLARLLVPKLADYCKIELLETGSGRRPVAIAHQDPDREALMRRLRERVTLPESERVGMARTFATGEPKLTPDIAVDAVARAASDSAGPAAGELMEAIGPRSQIVVPLRARGRVLGALSLTMAESGRRYSEADLDLARDLGSRAGLAVDNARLYEEAQAAAVAEQRRAGRLEALGEVSLAVHGTRELEERLRIVAERARRLMGVPWASVHLVGSRQEPIVVALGERPGSGRLSVPLVARDGAAIGAIEVSAGDFSVADRTMLEDLARIASPAIDNARLEERERHVAQTLQNSLLPTSLPAIPGLQAAARYLAGGEGTVVGGDLYDLFRVDDDWALVVGDVCGKGAEAAALTAMVRYTIRAEVVHHRRPGEVLGLLNDAILRQHDDGRFCTVVHGRLRVDGGHARIALAGAGHPPPLVRRAGGSVETVLCGGPLLGIVPDVEHPDVPVDLGPGDALVCFTDGVTEGRGPDGLFGESRLAEAVAGAGEDAGAIADAVVRAVLEFQGGRTHDDLALLVLRVPEV